MTTFARENPKKEELACKGIFIYLAYDGTNYHGWQIQPNGISVQECLMKALSTFLRREIEVIEQAGRMRECMPL